MSELPEGFVLDEPKGQGAPVPEGFVLDDAPADDGIITRIGKGLYNHATRGFNELGDAIDGNVKADPDKSMSDVFFNETMIGSGLKSVYDAVNLPREVYEGGVDLNTDEGTRRVLDATTVIGPTTAGRFGLGTAPKVIPAEVAGAEQIAKPANPVIESAGRLSEQGSPLNVPMGVATESPALQAAFMRGRQAPGATATVERSLDDFYKGVETKVGEVANTAAGGAVKDPTSLGASVRTSLEKAIDKSEEASADAFKIMRRAIDPEKRVNALTEDAAKTLDEVVASRTSAGEDPIAGRLAPAFKILKDPEGVSFSGLQRARSQVGRAIKWDEAQGGFNSADLKKVYGALTSAMESTAKQTARTSPDGAVKLWKAADARFSKMADDNKVLASVLRKDADEGLVSSLIGMASNKSGNARKLEQILREIGPESRNEVSGFVIQGLGQGRDGNFSAVAFTNNWQKLSTTGRSQLFRDPVVRQALDDLAKITERMAGVQKKFDNSSRTGGALGQMASTAGLVTNPVQTIAALVGANLAARALSRPATAKAMADYSRAMEMYVRRPSAGTKRLAQQAAAKLSNRFAAEFGAKVGVSGLLNDTQPSAKDAVQGLTQAIQSQ